MPNSAFSKEVLLETGGWGDTLFFSSLLTLGEFGFQALLGKASGWPRLQPHTKPNRSDPGSVTFSLIFGKFSSARLLWQCEIMWQGDWKGKQIDTCHPLLIQFASNSSSRLPPCCKACFLAWRNRRGLNCSPATFIPPQFPLFKGWLLSKEFNKMRKVTTAFVLPIFLGTLWAAVLVSRDGEKRQVCCLRTGASSNGYNVWSRYCWSNTTGWNFCIISHLHKINRSC